MHSTGEMTIGMAARRAGCSVPTIRYYEQIGLLPPAARRSGGHRVYREADLRRLTFVRRCRDFGFAIDQIRALAALAGQAEQDCAAARSVAQRRLDEVRRKIGELRALERDLDQIITDCDDRCAGEPDGRCVILADMMPPEEAGT